MSMGKTIVITGATSGIGLAVAKHFVQAGWKAVLIGRRAERLEEVQHQLGGHEWVWPLCVDIRDSVAIEKALAALPSRFSDITTLVNNAGLALGMEPAQSCRLEEWQTMIDTNITGLVHVTHSLLPRLVAAGSRAIIVNMGSIAGTYPYPGGNVYGATKAFVHQFSLNLRTDLHGTGVRVACIEPGMVETEFSAVRFRDDLEQARSVYEGAAALQPEDIAGAIHWVVSQPPHVNINRIEIMPTTQSSAPLRVYRS